MSFWHDARLMRRAANALAALAALGLLVAAGAWFVHRPQFTLHGLSIEAAAGGELRHVSAPLLRSTVMARIQGNFFTVDLEGLRKTFEQVPWVRQATVRRVWPDRIRVTLEEHRAFAYWGDDRLMNIQGELFVANLAEAEDDGVSMPEFSGPNGSEARLLARYAELNNWLAPVSRRVTGLQLSSRYAWTAELDDGTTLILGRDEGVPIQERVTRWASVYPRVRARFDRDADVVDLRYPNGFAVRSVSFTTTQRKSGATPVRHGE